METDMDRIDWSQRSRAADRDAADSAAQARAYLAQTDWYVARLAETGKPIPTSILAARATAREIASTAKGTGWVAPVEGDKS
jgi:hypothetical protein